MGDTMTQCRWCGGLHSDSVCSENGPDHLDECSTCLKYGSGACLALGADDSHECINLHRTFSAKQLAELEREIDEREQERRMESYMMGG